jgi:hypothetical protein
LTSVFSSTLASKGTIICSASKENPEKCKLLVATGSDVRTYFSLISAQDIQKGIGSYFANMTFKHRCASFATCINIKNIFLWKALRKY